MYVAIIIRWGFMQVSFVCTIGFLNHLLGLTFKIHTHKRYNHRIIEWNDNMFTLSTTGFKFKSSPSQWSEYMGISLQKDLYIKRKIFHCLKLSGQVIPYPYTRQRVDKTATYVIILNIVEVKKITTYPGQNAYGQSTLRMIYMLHNKHFLLKLSGYTILYPMEGKGRMTYIYIYVCFFHFKKKKNFENLWLWSILNMYIVIIITMDE